MQGKMKVNNSATTYSEVKSWARIPAQGKNLEEHFSADKSITLT